MLPDIRNGLFLVVAYFGNKGRIKDRKEFLQLCRKSRADCPDNGKIGKRLPFSLFQPPFGLVCHKELKPDPVSGSGIKVHLDIGAVYRRPVPVIDKPCPVFRFPGIPILHPVLQLPRPGVFLPDHVFYYLLCCIDAGTIQQIFEMGIGIHLTDHRSVLSK